jgi:hypothetical protein
VPTAFISHTHADAPIARQIEQALREFGVDAIDVGSIPSGANLRQSINDMLKTADGYVFVVSQDFAKSEWANVELAAAVADTTSGLAKPIVPILIGNVDPDRDLPELLRHYQWLDLRAGMSRELVALLAASLAAVFFAGRRLASSSSAVTTTSVAPFFCTDRTPVMAAALLL